VTLTFESADQILWCDHSNETSLRILTHGPILFFHKIKFGNVVEICFWLNLAVKVLKLTCLMGKEGSRQVMLQLNHYQRQGRSYQRQANDRAACPKDVLEFTFFSSADIGA